MKMKCHKIPNIKKTVCTAEQKVAYNMAFMCHISFQDKYNACETEMQRCDLLSQMRDFHIRCLQAKEDEKKWNYDAIFAALNSGLRKYMEHPFIASDYEKIGEYFKIPYAIV